ncbi:MAG: peptide ABC transporter substrate-binding protein [Lachnospiraceae bacterium]|nr:peptide ABC transporter substrate-binding protein [Lachnospiraceae bacterium]
MKKTITRILSLAFALSLLTACGSESQTDTQSEGSQAEEQNESPQAETQYINTFIASDPSTLDCARFLGVVDRVILHSITEPLTRIQDGIVTAAGAESWEISDDGLTYTFHLRENYWEDGQKVTASDYAYAMQRQAAPANAWSFASDFFSIVNYEAVYNGEADASALGVTVQDDTTLVITLSEPNPAFLSTVDIFPCRQSDVEENGDTYGSEAGTILSCGPFKLDSWVHNSQLNFSKNDQYWDKDNVALDRFTNLVIDDEGAQMASLENGSIDYASVVSQEYAGKFDTREDMYKLEMPLDRTVMVVFNCEDEIFASEKIRQAFSLALDRNLLIEITNGGLGTPAYGLVPTVCYVGDLNYRENAPEPLKALESTVSDPKDLLIEGMEEAGLGSDPSALTVTFTYSDTSAKGRTDAELYQQLWRDLLGVEVEIDFNESATANIRAGEYQVGSVGWGSTYEPLFQLSRWSTGGQSFWVNDEYAALVAEGSASMDEAARLEKYLQAEEMLVTEAAIAPVYYNASRTYAYNYVGGIPVNPFDTTGMKTYSVNGR